jgi:hypothetical protein
MLLVRRALFCMLGEYEKTMAKWVDSYPALLPVPTRGQFTLRPVRGAQWRRTATGEFFVADDDNAIPAADVQMEDVNVLFPGHADLFPPVVATVLAAAASGFMNDYEALPQEQVDALRLLIACPRGVCPWASDAVDFLINADCYADDTEGLPAVVEELKKGEYKEELVRELLCRTDVDRVRKRRMNSFCNIPRRC